MTMLRMHVPASMSRHPLAGLRIVIADADRHIARLVANVLESLGFGTVYLMPDGEQALAVILRERIDIVITDWPMTPMDGITLTRRLRAHPDHAIRQMPILLLTAETDPSALAFARDAGVTEFVMKPFTAASLCDRIAHLIEQPRSFILHPQFIGPDRRRTRAVPPGGVEKRGLPPLLTPRSPYDDGRF